MKAESSRKTNPFYGPSVQSMDTQLGVRQGRWTPAGSPRSSSTFREGGLEGRREWNPRSPGEPGPRRGGPLIASPSRSNLSAPGLRPANARYQTNAVAQGSARRSGITLLYLPPYSPSLNLIERLWKFVKHRALCGRYQPTFAQFQAAIQEALGGLSTTHAEKLKSLMTLKFQRFEDVSLMAA